MRHAPFLFFLLLVIALPSVASALSLGGLEILSKPGEPFRASAQLTLEAQESIQALALGSVNDYALVNLTRPAIVNQITIQQKQENGRQVIWLQSDVALHGENLFILLHITSNQRTYLPFFRLSTPKVPLTVAAPPPATPKQATLDAQESAKPESVPKKEQKTADQKATLPIATLDTQEPAKPESVPKKEQKTADQKATLDTQESAKPESVPKKEQKTADPQQTTYGPVRHGETLTKIAKQVAGTAAVTDWQVQVAIWKRNPDLFTMNNMNGLKEDSILLIPSPTEMTEIDPHEAETLRTEHIAAWQKMVAQGVVRVSPQMASTSTSSTAATKKRATKQPETKQPETKQPETKQPETKQPETKQPETRQPETKQPQSAAAVELTRTVPQQPNPVSLPQTKPELEPLNRISTQLQTIQGQLERNQNQFDRLIDRVSTLESGQHRFDELHKRLSTLEERLTK